MARGETLGQRRRRRRARRSDKPPGSDHSLLPEPPTAEEELRDALEQRPEWVKAIWRTPGRRLAFSALFLAIGLWILISTLVDPGVLARRRWAGGFIFAPAGSALFAAQAVQACLDFARGTDSLPVFHRLGWWFDRRGWPLVGAYFVV